MIRKTFWLAGALSLVLAACDDDDDDDLVNPPGNTSVSVALTSTSGDVVSSVITIDQIMLQGSGVTRVDLLDAPVTVNLTDLANATQEIVTGALTFIGYVTVMAVAGVWLVTGRFPPL